MQRIKVHSKGLAAPQLSALIELAKSAVGTTTEIEVVDAVGSPDPDCEDEVILILMSPAVCAAAELEEELKKAPNGGRRAVCIWPNDAEATSESPKAARNYAYSIVPWDAEKLRGVLASDDVFCFETAMGVTLPKVPMDHNQCVDEGEKGKQKTKAK